MVQTRAQRLRQSISNNQMSDIEEETPCMMSRVRRRPPLRTSIFDVEFSSTPTNVKEVNEYNSREDTKVNTFKFGQTMTYMCSDFNNNSTANPSADCTCYFLNLRNRVDLQQISNTIQPRRFSWLCKCIIIIAVGVVIATAYYLYSVFWSPNITTSLRTISSPVKTKSKWEVIRNYPRNVLL